MSESYNKLIETLQSIFEMDKADLDFGIYRIMNQKRDEINKFLQEDLLPQVKQAFADYQQDGKEDLQQELQQAIEQAKKFGAPDPENTDAVLEIKQKMAQSTDVVALENDVFSKLHTFFSRYYDKGDFISLRRYKADTYAIPYEGEEVKLYWANHDQYYIKSSEHLRDYAFTTKDPNNEEKSVRIKLVEADTEKDNIKAKADDERRFVLDEENPLSIENNELLIHFTYISMGKQKQETLNKAAIETILNQENTEFADWIKILKTSAPTETNANRTLLEKHLNDYTARNTFDYFIHKDLGAFLNRELDFFIKNEVLHLDDIDDIEFLVTEKQVRKIKLIKVLAKKIIRILAQLEDFQKKLWLKKKFVLESNYCITLDRVPKELYEDILDCNAQWEKWSALGFFERSKYESRSEKEKIIEKQNCLMVDTGLFDFDFKYKLLATIENLDNELDGLIINSENHNAINFLSNKYKNKIDVLYIDPPYNTDASEIIYKNGYRDSSWLSLIESRLKTVLPLTKTDSIQCITIDDVEFHNLRSALNYVVGSNNIISVAVIKNNPSGRSTAQGFSIAHEYAIFFSKNEMISVGRLERSEKQKARYSEKDDAGNYEWVNFRKHGGVKEDAPTMFYPIFILDDDFRIPDMEWEPEKQEWVLKEKPKNKEYIEYPIDENGIERRWKWGLERFQDNRSEFAIRKDKNGHKTVYVKARMNEEGMLPLTIWDKKEYSATSYGANLLKDIFGNVGSFTYPKSVYAVEDCLRVSKCHSQAIILDYFAGSGTTGHAVINLNDKDNGERKYILVEMGKHFETALKPRLEKIVFSRNWKKGKPETINSNQSHIFKYIKLESYEDSLNNLRPVGITQSLSNQQQALLKENDQAYEDYMLDYWMNVETTDSPSLLNLERFDDPFNYKLNIGSGSVGATKPVTVDLVETFNYLVGITVNSIDVIRGFTIVTGSNPQDETVLVVWRNVKEKDNAALEEFLDKQGYNPRDTEFAHIYVNGDHTLDDPFSKVKMTEIEFKRLMFDVSDI